MPKKLFDQLDQDKRARIMRVALEEFAQFSYDESSTNRIVKHAGISKGSLFQYFHNKEDLYFYLLDCIIEELTADLLDDIATFPQDVFDRTIKYAELEFVWYIHHPLEYQLIKKAFVKSNTEIYKKTQQRYALKSEDVFYRIFEHAHTDQLRWKKEKVLKILKWFVQGLNEEFIQGIQTQDHLDALKEEYLKRLVEYMEILKYGLVAQGGEG